MVDPMIKEMQYFCAVVQQHSLAGAARQLGVSTPMMTRHIQHLEQELDTKLLNRTTRDMSLTESGELFYQSALEIIKSYETGKRSIHKQCSEVCGKIKIALPASIASQYFVPNLHKLHTKYPELEIELIQGNHMLDMIHHGFDCVLFCGSMPSSDFYYKKITTWRKHVCASPGFLKSHTQILTPNQLLHTNCLLHSNNRKKSWQFKHKASNKRFDLYIEPSCKADSSLLLAEMAAQGLGICHLPSFTVEPYLRSGRLVSILDEWMPEPLDIFVVYPDKNYLNKKLEVLIEFITTTLPEN